MEPNERITLSYIHPGWIDISDGDSEGFGPHDVQRIVATQLLDVAPKIAELLIHSGKQIRNAFLSSVYAEVKDVVRLTRGGPERLDVEEEIAYAAQRLKEWREGEEGRAVEQLASVGKVLVSLSRRVAALGDAQADMAEVAALN